MSEFFARYEEDGSITAGPIEGQEWRGVRETSRFWPIIEEWQDAGNTIQPYQSPTPTIDEYRQSIQACVDAKAAERGYDSGHAMATYTASAVAQWALEAQAFVAWRDAVWVYAFAELAKVESGEREQPTPEQICSELPTLDWPEGEPVQN